MRILTHASLFLFGLIIGANVAPYMGADSLRRSPEGGAPIEVEANIGAKARIGASKIRDTQKTHRSNHRPLAMHGDRHESTNVNQVTIAEVLKEQGQLEQELAKLIREHEVLSKDFELMQARYESIAGKAQRKPVDYPEAFEPDNLESALKSAFPAEAIHLDGADCSEFPCLLLGKAKPNTTHDFGEKEQELLAESLGTKDFSLNLSSFAPVKDGDEYFVITLTPEEMTGIDSDELKTRIASRVSAHQLAQRQEAEAGRVED